MELEFKQNRIHGYELILESTIPHEETMEMIVPDTCPDVGEILDTDAIYFLRTKDSQEGRAELTGLVRATVLYHPEDGSGVRKLELNLPIHCRTDQGGIHSGCKVIATPRVEGAETRMLNSRKVLVRVNVLVDVAVYAPVEHTIASDGFGEDSWGVERLTEFEDTYIPMCVQEKQFTHADQISISGNHPEVEELLKTRVSITCPEKKVIGNKLIIKGVAQLQLIYRAKEGLLCSTDHEVPFSQIMEVHGVGEECDIQLNAILTSGEYHMVGSDGRTIGVNLGILLQGTLHEGIRLPLLKDLYSTCYEAQLEWMQYPFLRLVDEGVKTQTDRTLIPLDTPPQSVCDAYIEMGTVNQVREGKGVTMATQYQVTVLYEGNEGQVKSHQSIIPVSCEIEVPVGERLRCSCQGEIYATPTAGGIEVRLVASFPYQIYESREVESICGGRLVQEEEVPGLEKPSIILRMVAQGERLWDIAKTYRTTTEEIRKANQLEDGMLMEQMLLIPKKRA